MYVEKLWSWRNPVPITRKFVLITVSKFSARQIRPTRAFHEEPVTLYAGSVEWAPFLPCAETQYDKSRRIFWGCGNPHAFVCSDTPSAIGKAGQNASFVYVSVLTVPGSESPYLCACIMDFWSFRRVKPDMSAEFRHECYPVSKLAIFRQSACRKRQRFVRNDKALSETTNACRKRQSFVGKFILSKEKPS